MPACQTATSSVSGKAGSVDHSTIMLSENQWHRKTGYVPVLDPTLRGRSVMVHDGVTVVALSILIYVPI